MRIHADLAAIRRIKWHEYLTRFLLGGAITVATGIIARHFGPVVGGLFLAFPAIFPASATLLDKHVKAKKSNAGIANPKRGRLAVALDARGAVMGAIALAVFAVIVWQALPRYNAAAVLGLALVCLVSLAALIWRLRKLHVYWSRRRT
jgi:hypothetical protein